MEIILFLRGREYNRYIYPRNIKRSLESHVSKFDSDAIIDATCCKCRERGQAFDGDDGDHACHALQQIVLT